MQDTFSAKIISLRKAKKWTQEQLAEKCGISRQAVAKWEKGQSVPDIFRLLELSDLFQVEVSYLMADSHTDDTFRYCTESFGNLYQKIFVFNLGENTYHLLNYNDTLWVRNISDSGTIDELIKTISNSIRIFEQNQKFISLFSRKNLIHLWQEGKKKVSLRNIHSFGKDESSWVECTVCFLNNNSEPICVFLVKTVDDIVKEEKKKQEEILGRQYIIDVLTKEYDSAHLINITEDTLYLLNFNNSKLHEFIKSDDDKFCYSKSFSNYVHKFVAKDEQQEVEEKLSPEYIKKMLTDRKSFSVFFTVLINGIEHRYEARCIRINDTSDFCVAMGFINRDLEARINKRREMYEEIIKTLAEDYDAVYLANLDSGKILYSYTDPSIIPDDVPIDAPTTLEDCFSDELTALHRTIVHPEDYEEFRKSISREVVTKELMEKKMFFITYRMLTGNNYEFYQTRIFRSIDFDKNHNFVVGIKNINSQINMAKNNMIRHEIDSLSGIMNKDGFKEQVSRIISQDNTKEYTYSLFIVDIDNFKNINKTFGSSIGDYVIVDTAKRLCIIFARDASSENVIARVGGDKFAVFSKIKKNSVNSPDTIIEAKAETICKTLRNKYQLGTNSVMISCCVGVSISKADSDSVQADGSSSICDYKTLYDQAETALQQVKSNRQDAYRIY